MNPAISLPKWVRVWIVLILVTPTPFIAPFCAELVFFTYAMLVSVVVKQVLGINGNVIGNMLEAARLHSSNVREKRMEQV